MARARQSPVPRALRRADAGRGGYIFLEVMLAVVFLSIAVVGLCSALNEAIQAATMRKFERHAATTIESMTEWMRRPPMEERDESTEADPLGMVAKGVVKPLELKDENNRALNGLWQVTVTVSWTRSGREDSRSETVVVYQP